MGNLKLRAHVDENGHLVLDLPLYLANHTVEVTVQMPEQAEMRGANDWPVGFFERLDAIQSDDLVERPEQLPLEVRDEVE